MAHRRIASILLFTLVAMAALSACGGGGGDDKAGDSGDKATTTAKAATPTTTASGLPQFSSDFSKVCTTEIGFTGAATYEPGPGPHPVAFFEQFRGKNLVASSRTLPDGWTVKEDDDYANNSELKAVQLVACSTKVKESPTGKKCDFKGDKEGDKPTTLELVNSTWELKVYEAKTAKLLNTATLEATEDECPFIATFEKGDTTFVAEPEDDQYVNALKPQVTPA